MKESQQRRVASSESTMRDVNEGIERGQWPGEEDSPVVETVIEARPGYVIVEKRDQAGEVAEERDPRA
jgi:hypothetical protein